MLKTSSVVPSPDRQKARIAPRAHGSLGFAITAWPSGRIMAPFRFNRHHGTTGRLSIASRFHRRHRPLLWRMISKVTPLGGMRVPAPCGQERVHTSYCRSISLWFRWSHVRPRSMRTSFRQGIPRRGIATAAVCMVQTETGTALRSSPAREQQFRGDPFLLG